MILGRLINLFGLGPPEKRSFRGPIRSSVTGRPALPRPRRLAVPGAARRPDYGTRPPPVMVRLRVADGAWPMVHSRVADGGIASAIHVRESASVCRSQEEQARRRAGVHSAREEDSPSSSRQCQTHPG